MNKGSDADERLMQRVSLQIANFKPFDGESYNGFARRLIAMIRDHDRALTKVEDTE